MLRARRFKTNILATSSRRPRTSGRDRYVSVADLISRRVVLQLRRERREGGFHSSSFMSPKRFAFFWLGLSCSTTAGVELDVLSLEVVPRDWFRCSTL